jgi:gliding motility-associated lipoprotein GldB
MRIFLVSCILCLLFYSCDKKTAVEKKIESLPVQIKIDRFDQVFFESSPKDLQKIKKRYPFFFPEGIPDSVWVNKINNPLWRELFSEVQKKYQKSESIEGELEKVFKHIRYHFPKTKSPKVFTVIAEMDYDNKVIYADSLVIISLEMYLGKDHKFYEFPAYIKQNFEQRQMMPDLVASFAKSKVKFEKDNTLLSQMIYHGKLLYMKDLFLPSYTDNEKMGYTPEEINWCQENESYIWRYFLENELLYSNELKLNSRFIAPAPFSKFYLEIDNESPGQVGAWIGWQIVRSYAKNNDVPVAKLLELNAKELFKKSKYKPNK